MYIALFIIGLNLEYAYHNHECNMKLSIVLFISALTLVLIAYTDMLLGYEFGFALFYLLPIVMVAWYSGHKLGLLFSCVAAMLWFCIDDYTGHHYEHPYAMLWNAMMRFGIFSLVAYLISRTHQAIHIATRLAQKDVLTGLYNRRGFLDLLQREIIRTHRYKHSFALVLIDLNQFKMINDIYGHQSGDRALKHFALLLQKNIRETDVLGRIGGDEFVLLLLDVTQDEAIKRMNTLQEDVASHAQKHPKLVASFSSGMLVCGPTKVSALELLSLVDKLMYEAKREGTTKVASAVLPPNTS